jgi:TorA maturation chaperone TorD
MHAALDAGKATPGSGRAHETDIARAQEYALLASLLSRAPDAGLLRSLAGIPGDATPIGSAHAALAAAAAAADPVAVEREYFTLFIGVGRGELLPFASYYRTGFLNERPLAEVRRDLAAHGFARAERVHEPEDHIGILCDVMGALASDASKAQGAFFTRHLEPWAGQFFADLATAPSADFYRAVGALGAAFVAVEAKAFAMDG